MFKKICLLTCHNQYESKRYFTQKLAEALLRKEIDTHILSWEHGPLPEELVDQIVRINPDLTATFHQLPEQSNKGYFWDKIKIPHLTMLLDPVFYDIELIKSPYSFISCVDINDCEFLRSLHFERTFFFPHAVEKELIQDYGHDRPIDVIMLGTCYDPDHLYDYWKKNYSSEILEVLEDAVVRVLDDNKTTFFRALLQSLTLHGICPKDIEFDELAYEVDCYSRGIERILLIRSISDAHIHIFGGKCWREQKPIEDWSYYFANQANITLHPPVNYFEALNLLKKSKICLNSMPFFKCGTHERIFASLACGAVPFTKNNQYLNQHFSDGNNLLFYSSFDEVNKKIHHFLENEKERVLIVKQGQEIVKKHHTWDTRVNLLSDITFRQ